jgi:heme exporter protein A
VAHHVSQDLGLRQDARGRLAQGVGAASAPGAPPGGVPLLEARGVVYAYGFRRVLDGVDLSLRAGEIVALLGPNGAGKSTLLRVLAGLSLPAAGCVCWGGRPLAELPLSARRMAFVGHRSHLFPELTARENLTYYARLLGLPDAGAVADAALRAEGLSLFADQPVATFSRGMQQRLSLCRAWLGEPLLCLADEPTTGLDPDAAGRLPSAFQRLCQRGGAALLVAHDLDAALAVADRFVILAAGRVAAAGPASPWRGQGEAFAAFYREAVRYARAGARRGGGGGAAGGAGAGGPAPPPGPGGGAAPGAAPRRLGVLRAVFTRELVLWWRGRERMAAILANGVLVALVFGLAFDPLAVDLQRVFAGLLWLGLVFTGLPAFARAFAAEWETDAVDGFLACGAEPALLFYGKCLANLLGFLLAAAVLVPVFLVLLEVRAGPDAGGAAAALLLGGLGFVPAASLVAAVVSRALAGVAAGLLPLVALPLLAPLILGTAHLVQGFMNGAPEMTGPWFLLLAAYAAIFWGLPLLVFPFVVAG